MVEMYQNNNIQEVKLKYNIILERITKGRMSVYRLNFKKIKMKNRTTIGGLEVG